MWILWIVVPCPVFLLMMTSSASALEWSLESLFYPMTYIGNNIENTFSKSLSRHKRADTASQYIIDIEVTVLNSSFINALRTLANELELPIEVMLNGTHLNITSLEVTAVCTAKERAVSCSCESGYVWPSNVCPASPTCVSSSTTCDCLTTYPSQGCERYQPPGPTVTRKMTMRIQKEYDLNMANPSSKEYQELKKLLNDSYLVAYRSLSDFQYANVTGFRNGSIIVDYIIVAGQVSDSNITSANSEVVSYLRAQNVTVDTSGFKTIVDDKTSFTALPVTVFQGDAVNLTCTTTSSSTAITWSHNGTKVTANGYKYVSSNIYSDGTSISTLTISQLGLSDGGSYTCSLDDGLNLYVQSTHLVVQLLTVHSNANIVCGNDKVDVFKCCTDGNIGSLKATCSVGAGGISGDTTPYTSCVAYSIQPDVSKCPFGSTVANYNCECHTGSGAKEERTIPVTFTRAVSIEIIPPTVQISTSLTFNLTCSTNATGDGTISWWIGREVDGKFYTVTGTSSVLRATATMDWEGSIYCVFTQNNNVYNQINASATIEVVDLPTKDSIIIDPIQKSVHCNSTSIPAVPIKCCYEGAGKYDVAFRTPDTVPAKQEGTCYRLDYRHSTCPAERDTVGIYCKFTNTLKSEVSSKEIQLVYFTAKETEVTCRHKDLGEGTEGATAVIQCNRVIPSTVGSINYTCKKDGWSKTESNCVSSVINDRVLQLEVLLKGPNFQQQIPNYLANLSSTVIGIKENVSSSHADIVAILDILQTVSDTVNTVAEDSMKNVIDIVSVIVESRTAWEDLRPAEKITKSSRLLRATETFAKKLEIVNNSIDIEAESRNISVKGANITADNGIYNTKFNFSDAAGDVLIPSGFLSIDTTVVTIAYNSLVDILPGDNNNTEVNSLVMSTVLNKNISKNDFKIVMTFPVFNRSLVEARCVYWNFSQANGTGGWDTRGCQANGTGNAVTCTCDHLTSFSILMSSSNKFTKSDRDMLNYITYIGVGISLASLFLCIVIEALVWKSVTKNKTSYMRHVCLVNIAVSLLIADIWFLVGARMSDILEEAAKNNTFTNAGDACVAATFFTQFFYLSLFFWMLTMGLILFYRMVYVFHDMSKSTMMAISFCLGYGCPLIISVITVAVTQPRNLYREELTCWLNFTSTKAFLAFVVPALIIVGANFIILIVVMVKLLRPSVGDKPKKEEKSTLIKIAKSVAVLTPLLGLTWGFGIGTMSSGDKVIHGIFAALNSLQGLFILVFATLWDSKVREALLHRFSLSSWASQQTKSTKTTTLSSSRTRSSKPNMKPKIKMPSLPKPGYNIFGNRGRYSLSSAFKSTSLEEGSYYSTLD
ncbi:adhesion G protein-coupled receptor F5-like [Pleurodeles waltl]|uniref:adhesion G protein-coupled receptor F5-like n=1 Tax=Pleurodeles waltl TaxID=8319 RepID=UPI0037097D94